MIMLKFPHCETTNNNNIFIRTFKTMAVQNTGKTLSTFS